MKVEKGPASVLIKVIYLITYFLSVKNVESWFIVHIVVVYKYVHKEVSF